MNNNPINIGRFKTDFFELMYVLYMPIKLKDQKKIIIPQALQPYTGFVASCIDYEGHDSLIEKYIYLTVKTLWVDQQNLGGRSGWHTDGFGTGDINYLWVDRHQTEFCNQPFDLSDDDKISMQEMSEQAQEKNIVQYPEMDIIRVNSTHVHRVPENISSGFRTFARVSFSYQQYNMAGNAHNYHLDYSWKMNKRGLDRNLTSESVT